MNNIYFLRLDVTKTTDVAINITVDFPAKTDARTVKDTLVHLGMMTILG